LPGFVLDQGADTVVAGGMGPRAVDMFRQWGIEPVTGAEGSVMDVLQAMLAGQEFQGDLCDHSGGGQECDGRHKH
jgi:predicted Fe-Mo cluster-binding NifX family protein